jgi:predicted Zn-dependent protease
MLNALLSLVAAVAVFVGVMFWMGPIPAVIPAVIVFLAAMLLLGKRINKKVEAQQEGIANDLKKGRIDAALAKLEAMRPLARWQVLFGASLDAEIGILLYAHKKDFEKARPHLEKATKRIWHSQAMLAAIHWRKKQDEEAYRIFEAAVKKNKKTGILWSVYAWCLWKRNRADEALRVLLRGKKQAPSDQVLARNLEALQNKKKMQLKGYGAEWWLLHLEEPPREMMQQQVPHFARPRRGGRSRFN